MGRVKVGDHLWINISRRSQCDNCIYEVCSLNHGGRITDCPFYVPIMMAFKRCARCGRVFEVSSNFRGLDYDICPECNSQTVIVHG